ncbi:hypothetical protein E1301_Tti017158 [Triplophysa tibetana]|uniref:Uncharacterized protein n=1 Tax=Triplophysa tibetana TaxID=1572043 RepID=A0A5A9PKZ8_9TELE|nr:hypothetical protein E1301_Tti017158 [Triplophysa tibetana]
MLPPERSRNSSSTAFWASSSPLKPASFGGYIALAAIPHQLHLLKINTRFGPTPVKGRMLGARDSFHGTACQMRLPAVPLYFQLRGGGRGSSRIERRHRAAKETEERVFVQNCGKTAEKVRVFNPLTGKSAGAPNGATPLHEGQKTREQDN